VVKARVPKSAFADGFLSGYCLHIVLDTDTADASSDVSKATCFYSEMAHFCCQRSFDSSTNRGPPPLSQALAAGLLPSHASQNDVLSARMARW